MAALACRVALAYERSGYCRLGEGGVTAAVAGVRRRLSAAIVVSCHRASTRLLYLGMRAAQRRRHNRPLKHRRMCARSEKREDNKAMPLFTAKFDEFVACKDKY